MSSRVNSNVSKSSRMGLIYVNYENPTLNLIKVALKRNKEKRDKYYKEMGSKGREPNELLNRQTI